MDRVVITTVTAAALAGAYLTHKFYQKKITEITEALKAKEDRTFFSSYNSGWREGEKHGRRMQKYNLDAKED